MPRVKKPRIQPVSSRFWLTVVAVSTAILLPRVIRMPVNSFDDFLVAILSALTFGVLLASLFFPSSQENRIV
jgi:hypothetical protein